MIPPHYAERPPHQLLHEVTSSTYLLIQDVFCFALIPSPQRKTLTRAAGANERKVKGHKMKPAFMRMRAINPLYPRGEPQLLPPQKNLSAESPSCGECSLIRTAPTLHTFISLVDITEWVPTSTWKSYGARSSPTS